jgi:malate dehydrogenase (oxaloacetate-decarboxylating)(NADP+)
VNNVLGFPGIFRGALDCHARSITEDMKMAASRALAEITREEVSSYVKRFLMKAYPEDAKARMFDGVNPLKPSYVIPKPFDPRIVPRVARYVAAAAIKTGVARNNIANLNEYEKQVFERIN